MSETTSSRRVLHLVVDGFPIGKLEAFADASTEILPLTEANARQVLEKIFAADTVAVWSDLQRGSVAEPQR